NYMDPGVAPARKNPRLPLADRDDGARTLGKADLLLQFRLVIRAREGFAQHLTSQRLALDEQRLGIVDDMRAAHESWRAGLPKNGHVMGSADQHNIVEITPFAQERFQPAFTVIGDDFHLRREDPPRRIDIYARENQRVESDVPTIALYGPDHFGGSRIARAETGKRQAIIDDQNARHN